MRWGMCKFRPGGPSVKSKELEDQELTESSSTVPDTLTGNSLWDSVVSPWSSPARLEKEEKGSTEPGSRTLSSSWAGAASSQMIHLGRAES